MIDKPTNTNGAGDTVHTQEIPIEQEVMSLQSEETFLAIADKRAGYIKKFIERGIKETTVHDWIDQNGVPYLMESGAEKIRNLFPMKISEMHPSKPIYVEDAKGQYYYFIVKGKFGWNDNEYMEVIGTCSSRDNLFARRGDEYLPIEDVDITNILKAAYTNCLVNGITRWLGLRNLTWELVEKISGTIKQDDVVKVRYGKGKQADQWEDTHKEKADRIRDYILAECNGDTRAAGDMLEGLTEFKGKDGMVPGKRQVKHLSGKRIEILYNKLKKKIETFEAAGYTPDEKSKDIPKSYPKKDDGLFEDQANG